MLVTFVATVVSKVGIMTEAVTGLLVVGFALTVHLVHQPYDDDVLDRLETYSLYATVITLVAGLYFLGNEIENDIKVRVGLGIAPSCRLLVLCELGLPVE